MPESDAKVDMKALDAVVKKVVTYRPKKGRDKPKSTPSAKSTV